MALTAFAFIAAYFSLVAACLVTDVSLGVYLYQGHYFLNPHSRWWGGHLPDLRYSFLVAVVILISFLLHNKKFSDNELKNFPQLKWYGLLIVMMTISYSYAVWPEHHLKNMIHNYKLFAFVLLAYKVIDTPNKYEKLLWAHLIGVFYIGWYGHGIGRIGGARLDGIGPTDGDNANDTAAVLITAVPILVYYLLHGKRWQRFVSLAFLAYIMDCIVLINSRGGFVGLLAAMTYFSFHVIFSRKRKPSQRFAMIAGIVVAVGLFVYLTDALFWSRMATLEAADLSGHGGGGSSRVYFWIKAIELAKNHPFGVGYWGYQYLSPTFLPSEMLTKGMRAVHSTYFQLLAEFGFIGPVLLGGLLWSNFSLARKTKQYLKEKEELRLVDQNVAVTAGYIAFLVAGAFIDRLYAEMMYWFPFYIASAWNILVVKDQKKQLSTQPST